MNHKPVNQVLANSLLILFVLLKIVLSYVWVNPVYELQRDEFLHLDQANHLAAGYTSVPPLTSIFSWIIKQLGNGLFVIRFFPALFGVLTIGYCWKIVDLLKGNLWAKSLVAIACICSVYLRLNTLFQPNSFDVLAWTAAFYYLLKFFDREKPLELYCLSIVVALGFLNKYNVVFLIAGLTPALLITSKRKVFLNKHLYLSILLGFVVILPNLIWQINHHFPVVTHMKVLQRTQLVHINRADFFINQLLFFVNAIFILLSGILSLIFYKPFQKQRWVIYTLLFTLAIFSYFRAKDYYALGLYPVILSFGAVYLSEVLSRRKMVMTFVFLFTIGSFLYVLPLLMPIYTPAQIVAHRQRFERVGLLRWEDGESHQIPQDYADMQGWKEMAKLTDMAYSRVKDKSSLLIRADNYGEAGAVNYYSRFKNLNAVSYNADYLYWFNLKKPIQSMIMIRDVYDRDPSRKKERPYFTRITKIGTVKNPYSMEYGASVFLLEGATIDVTSRIESEIKEEQNDH